MDEQLSQLEQFLRTDPRDVGCEQALAVLHVYVDLTLAGARPELRYPGIAEHLRACGPCSEDFEGLLAAASDARLGAALPPTPISIEPHTGPRDELRALFEEADDSSQMVSAYIDDGTVLVARAGDRVVGHLQLVDTGEPGALEIKNMAVDSAYRGSGIGRALIEAAAQRAATLVVATAAADIGNLRFYQRAGFRMRSVERDAFTQATGYPADLESDGIPVRDRVWLDRRGS